MNLLVSLFIIFMFPAYSFAEQWVCFDATTKKVLTRLQGDGVQLGICQSNNMNIVSTCILAEGTEYTDANASYKKVDVNLSNGSRVVDMTLIERTAYDQNIQQIQNDILMQLANELDVTNKDIFTAFIKVYNSKMPLQYRITKQELIDQLKADLGL